MSAALSKKQQGSLANPTAKGEDGGIAATAYGPNALYVSVCGLYTVRAGD